MPNSFNAGYKARFSSLNALFLSGALNDTVLYPWQSSQFGGFKWNTTNELYTFFESDLYTQDTIGLQALYAANKTAFSSFEGGHLGFTTQYWDSVVLPYFNNFL